MCQSLAQGGRRCNGHLKLGVSDQMTTYAIASTGLPRKRAEAMMKDLEREGADLPDPSREEVDAWIDKTAAQVTHDDQISDSMKDRILGRLRDAYGKVMPTGAQFHAWKAALGEAFARSRRTASAFFLAGVISFGGACGVGGGAAEPAPAPAPSVTATTVAPGYEEMAAAPIDNLAFYDGVREEFGADRVDAGYAFVSDIALSEAMDEDTMRRTNKTFEPSDIDPLRPKMSPTLQQKVDNSISCMTTDEQCANDVGSLVQYGFNGNGYELRKGTSPVIQKKVTNARAFKDVTDGRLGYEFTQSGTMRYVRDGKPVLVDYTHPVSYWVVDDGNGGFLLDGYTSKGLTYDNERPDPQ